MDTSLPELIWKTSVTQTGIGLPTTGSAAYQSGGNC